MNNQPKERGYTVRFDVELYNGTKIGVATLIMPTEMEKLGKMKEARAQKLATQIIKMTAQNFVDLLLLKGIEKLGEQKGSNSK